METQKRRRRWFRFRLRTLLIMITVLSVSLGWVGWELDQRRRDEQIVAWVEESGGHAAFRTIANPNYEEISWWERKKDEWLGEMAYTVSIGQPPVADLSPLAKCKNLKGLAIFNANEHDLSQLADLKNLEELLLFHRSISEKQVEMIKLALPNCDVECQESQ